MDEPLLARAPSNIALVKYMGKSDPSANLPAHGSVSMTLDSLHSVSSVRVEGEGGESFRYEPASPAADLEAPSVTVRGLEKIEKQIARVRVFARERFGEFGLEGAAGRSLSLRCGNSFPAGAGIASSASSFASITLASLGALAADHEAFRARFESDRRFRGEISALSRRGSGSSCRSFEGPWVHWEGESAGAVESSLPGMTDLVAVVDASEKEVSSSEAHLRVTGSPLWPGRVERASARVRDLLVALEAGDLRRIAWLSWTEAWEMHSLFHTAAEPFTYWQPGTVEFLRWISLYVKPPGEGAGGRMPGFETPPVVTLDAGPNIHVLVPSELAASWRGRIRDRFPGLRLLEDTQGGGAKLLAAEARG